MGHELAQSFFGPWKSCGILKVRPSLSECFAGLLCMCVTVLHGLWHQCGKSAVSAAAASSRNSFGP